MSINLNIKTIHQRMMRAMQDRVSGKQTDADDAGIIADMISHAGDDVHQFKMANGIDLLAGLVSSDAGSITVIAPMEIMLMQYGGGQDELQHEIRKIGILRPWLGYAADMVSEHTISRTHVIHHAQAHAVIRREYLYELEYLAARQMMDISYDRLMPYYTRIADDGHIPVSKMIH